MSAQLVPSSPLTKCESSLFFLEGKKWNLKEEGNKLISP